MHPHTRTGVRSRCTGVPLLGIHRAIRRTVVPSWRALLRHRVRTVLVVLSIGIAVAAVVLTSAIGAGAREDIVKRIGATGTNLLLVKPLPVANLVSRKTIRGSATTLDLDDADEIAALSLVGEVAPSVDRAMRVKAGNIATIATVVGTTLAFPRARQFQLRSGSYFSTEDDDAARRVAVLGARVAATLFPAGDAVGNTIHIGRVLFEVIGVFAAKGTSVDGADQDSQLVIPIRTALRRVFNADWLTTIFVSVRQPQRLDAAERQVTDVLRARHRRVGRERADDFAVQNLVRLVGGQQMLAQSMTTATDVLAAVSLLGGAAGMLSLMLLAVRERRREIGLRKAVGARSRQILVQFLCEAMLLVSAGVVTGVALAGAGGVAVAYTTRLTLALPVDALLASALVSVAAGAIVGVIPAMRAARVPPIEALLAT